MDAEDVILYDLLFCIQRPQERDSLRKTSKKEEDCIMDMLTWIFTLFGAATLARGLMEIIAHLEGE